MAVNHGWSPRTWKTKSTPLLPHATESCWLSSALSMFWTPLSIPWLTPCLWFTWLGTASWNFLVTSSECQRKGLLEDMLCASQPLTKGDLVDHVLHSLPMYKECLGIMKEQCKNSRLPHLLMIVVHGETLWSPALQLMDDDDVQDMCRWISLFQHVWVHAYFVWDFIIQINIW